MRVFIIPSWYVTEDKPGNGIFFKEQAMALKAAGVEVVVIYPDLRFKLGALQRGLFKVDGEGIDTYIYRGRSLTPFIEPGRWPQRMKMLEKLYQAAVSAHGRPDVVQLHSCRMGVEAVWLCKKHSLPLIYTEHYSGILIKKISKLLEYAFKKTLAGCTTSLAVSNALLLKMKPLRPDTEILPNLVNTECFKILMKKPISSEFIFAAMGNLIPVKNYDHLLTAFAKAAIKIPNARLIIAGEGIEREKLFTLSKELKINERVKFCGYVSREMATRFFSSIDSLVCSSKIETFGMTLIEAMACGKPVISTRCGGPEGIVEKINGLLINVGDISDLVNAMIYMYENIDKYDDKLISENCSKRFGSKTVTARLIKIYENAARFLAETKRP